jgi:hypothetical protein
MKENALRGSQRLFDQKISLLYASSPLTETESPYEFKFSLHIPSNLPCTFKDENIQVQYMIIAGLSFRNGCCGFIPMFAREPVVAVKELTAVREQITSKLNTRISAVQEALQTGSMLIVNPDQIAGHPAMFWSPSEHVLVTIPALIRLKAAEFHLGLACSPPLSIRRISWQIRQKAKLRFQSNFKSNKEVDDSLRYKATTVLFSQGSSIVDMISEDEVHLVIQCELNGGMKPQMEVPQN